MSDIKCRNCKHWDKDDRFARVEFHKCNRIEHSEDALNWDEDYTKEALTKENEFDLALAVDGSGYYAGIITKADFFCAHFLKEEANK